MNLSPAGLAFLEHEEGLRTSSYPDSGGRLTIGVGHLLTETELESGSITIGETAIPWRPGLTLQQVTDLLGQDCAARETALSSLVICPLTQNQFDALFSLAYNIGLPAFGRSSLLKILNGGDWTELDDAWQAWRFAGGKPVLLDRRNRELALFKETA